MKDKLARARAKALDYIARKGRTVLEVDQYLTRKGFARDVVEAVLVQLEQVGLLDDGKLARQWVDYRLGSKPAGKRRLAHDLARRGVARPVIEEALQDIDLEKEWELAERLLARYANREWSRAKLFRFLSYRGFSHVIIEELCNRHAPDKGL